MTKWASEIFLLLTALITFMSGCELQKVNLQTNKISVRIKWLQGSQFTILYSADQKEFYQLENFKVRLVPFVKDHYGIELAASGRNDFRITGVSQIISAHRKGKELIAVFVNYRINPPVCFDLIESGIRKPIDIIEKQVLVHSQDFVIGAMLNNFNLDLHIIEVIQPGQKLDVFFQKNDDILTGYLKNQVINARRANHEVNIIYSDDYYLHV